MRPYRHVGKLSGSHIWNLHHTRFEVAILRDVKSGNSHIPDIRGVSDREITLFQEIGGAAGDLGIG